MKPGDIVTHAITGNRLQIIRLTDEVATCELIDEPEEWVMRLAKKQKPRVVCQIINLVEK